MDSLSKRGRQRPVVSFTTMWAVVSMMASGVSAQHRDYWVSALRRVTSSAEWRQFVELNQWQPNFVGPDDTARELKHQVQQTRALLAELRLGLPNAPAVAQWPPNPAPKVALFPAGAPAAR